MKNLKQLDISRNSKNISDACLDAIAQLTGLEILELPKGITDAGLSKLKDLTRLKKLDIGRVELTGTGLDVLRQVKTLTYLQFPQGVQDQDLAVRFVQQLSKVYRYILEIRDRKLICLSEELAFLDAYVFLLKERFGENFKVEINIPESYLNLKVVPLSLQILMENAIKHNIISALKPLKIEVFIEPILIVIVCCKIIF